MTYPIVKYGAQVLERKAEPVTEFDTPDLLRLIGSMFDAMYVAKGVGLAAPQIGVGKRIAVIDVADGQGAPQPLVLINPEIIHKEGSQTGMEGCLSLPGFAELVHRAQKVTVRAQRPNGEVYEITGEGMLARALQHETDHLNGTLYISHISPLKRDLICRKIRKLRKDARRDHAAGIMRAP